MARRLVSAGSDGPRRGVRLGWAVIVLLPVVFAACTAPPLNQKRFISFGAQPSDLFTGSTVFEETYNPGGTCGLQTSGLLVVVPPAEMKVGFDHFYDPGTNPLPCEVTRDFFFRGAVKFRLTAIQKLPRKLVTRAILNFVVRASVLRLPNGQTRTTASCVDEVLVANVDPTGVKGPTPGSGIAVHGPGADVTAVVQAWVSGSQPNFGFVLKGRDEGTPKDNAACFSFVRNVTLDVEVLVP